jgi:hydroxyacylglutathione hydrolase
MYKSLCDTLASLPPETRVFCGHEYTVKNLEFSAHVEPDNDFVRTSLEGARAKRKRGEPTVGSTLADERRHNPFMRVAEPSFAARYGGADPVTVLGKVRKEKDDF